MPANSLAIVGLIAVTVFLLFVASKFAQVAEEEKEKPEVGRVMVMVVISIYIILTQVWIIVLTAGQ